MFVVSATIFCDSVCFVHRTYINLGDNSVESGAVTKRFEIRCDLALVKRTFGARMLHYGLVGTISRKAMRKGNRQVYYTEIIATGTEQGMHNFEIGLPLVLQQLGIEGFPCIEASSVDILNNHNDVRILKTGNFGLSLLRFEIIQLIFYLFLFQR